MNNPRPLHWDTPGGVTPNADAIRAALCCDRPGCECVRPGGNVHCPVPGHGRGRGDRHPSLSITERDGRVLVHCHADCSQEAVIDALRQRTLWSTRDGEQSGRVPEIRYALRDPEGKVVAVHVRADRPNGSKSLTWERPDGKIGLGGRPVTSLSLYGVHLLRERPGEPVILVEGEKAAQALLDVRRLALGTVTGAGATPSEEALRPLVGRDVILWPDADGAGRHHMERIAALLHQLGLAPRWVEWPDAPPGGDAADFVARNGAGEALGLLLATAPPVAEHNGRAVLIRIADVSPKPVRWLWPGRIPLGKVTVLDGDPGLAKSLLTLDLAARVTRSKRMPDGAPSDLPGPRGVLLLTAEDDPEDTVRPRLDAGGADVGRIVLLARVKDPRGDRMPTIADLDAVEEAIRRVDAALVIIDPLMAYLPDERDSHRDQDIRRALAPLADLAARTGVAILVVRHLNKSGGGNPLYRGGGSIGIIGAARSGLLVAPDPDAPDNGRRILAVTKANLTAPPPAMAYHVAAPDGVPCIVWEGPTEHTATGLLATTVPEGERSALKEAEDFLRQVLATGPVAAKQVQTDARGAGISERTLKRAKASIGVVTHKDGFTGGWTWALPASVDLPGPAGGALKRAKSPEEGQTPEHVTLRQLWHASDEGALPKEEPPSGPPQTLATSQDVGEEASPEDLARASGRGAFIWRVGEARAWKPYPYAPGKSIGAGKRTWLTFIRNNADMELIVAAEALLRESGPEETP